MRSTEFRLVTEWKLDAPIACVWQALADVETWPLWWPSVRRVEVLERRGGGGPLTALRLEWRTALPYRVGFVMKVTRAEPPILIEGEAQGELDGIGRWTLEPADGRCHVRYEWRVRVTKWWMRALAPVLRPVFAWNHDVVMERGRRGLAEYLAVE